MKKYSLILLAFLTLAIAGCDNSPNYNRATSDNVVTDEFGNEFHVITIDGCKFYEQYGEMLSKVDCNCVPLSGIEEASKDSVLIKEIERLEEENAIMGSKLAEYESLK